MTCPCTSNPDPHECVFVLPWEAAALTARPIETIHTWRKTGAINAQRTDRWRVCICETADQARTTAQIWRRHADRKVAPRN